MINEDNMMNKSENVADSFVARNKENLQLYAIIKMFRYQRELKMIEDDIKANCPMPMDGNKFTNAIIDGTVNAIRRKKTQDLSVIKKNVLDKMEIFKEKCKDDGIQLSDASRSVLIDRVEKAFKDDTHGLQKNCFAMTLCLQDEKDGDGYVYGDETLRDVSEILFNDRDRIALIKDKFYANFKDIYNGGSFWDRNKYFFIGVGISLSLVAVLTPIAITTAAASSAVFTSCLAQIGHCAPFLIGAGVAQVTGLAVVSTAILGGTLLAGVGIAEIFKNRETKKAFRNLNPDELAALLAMKATLLGFGMTEMNSESYKKELDECLSGLNDMRADAEYMLIVEKNDADNSKKKINICNRFVNRLAYINGI